MIYWLLFPLADKVTLFNVLRYPSFRVVMAGLTALLFCLVVGPWFIGKLRAAQDGLDTVREDTPDSHLQKTGTPSMGGLLILSSLFLGTLLWVDLTNHLIWTVLTITAGFAAVGFYDDWRKFKNGTKGLSGRAKLAIQFGIAGVAIYAFLTDWSIIVDSTFPFVKIGFLVDTTIALPFVATHIWTPDLGFLYPVFVVFVVVGTSHAVNLTDGLDGLAIGPSIVAAITWLVLAYAAGTIIAGFNIAEYLYIPHIEGAEELSVFCAALAGAGIGFLWYNTYPATVFMGDVGSLSIGGGLGAVAILTKNELVSAIVHGVFLIEALSVILQVGFYKSTGRRIFRMAPIHHHFELKGWAEPKVIVRFWIMSIILALVAVAGLKLR